MLSSLLGRSISPCPPGSAKPPLTQRQHLTENKTITQLIAGSIISVWTQGERAVASQWGSCGSDLGFERVDGQLVQWDSETENYLVVPHQRRLQHIKERSFQSRFHIVSASAVWFGLMCWQNRKRLLPIALLTVCWSVAGSLTQWRIDLALFR